MQGFNVVLNELRRGLIVFSLAIFTDIALTLLLKVSYQQYLNKSWEIIATLLVLIILLCYRNITRNFSLVAYDTKTYASSKLEIIEGKTVLSVYRIVNNILANSINKVDYEGKADISLKKTAYLTMSPILSSYVLNVFLRKNRSIEDSMGDLSEYIKYNGRLILSYYKSMMALRVVSVIVVFFSIFIAWNVPLFWLLLVVVIPVLSFSSFIIKLMILEGIEEVEYTVPIKLDLVGTAKEIAEANPVEFEWYTDQVLSDSMHVIFKKEVKKDGQPQVHGRGENTTSRSGEDEGSDESGTENGSQEEEKEIRT